jgi:hypothetical protein
VDAASMQRKRRTMRVLPHNLTFSAKSAIGMTMTTARTICICGIIITG